MSELLLAIETATSNCSVALTDGVTTYQRQQNGSNVHSQVLLPMVAEVLAEAGGQVCELAAVAVGQGPGSFTGLRIGVGVAQGLAYGSGCPMIGVSSLAALALQAVWSDSNTNSVLSGIDARMNEIYCAEFIIKQGMPLLEGEFCVLAPELVQAKFQHSTLAGNGWQAYWPRFGATISQRSLPDDDCCLPTATAVLALAQQKYARGEVIDPRQFRPDYIRDNVAKKAGNPKPV